MFVAPVTGLVSAFREDGLITVHNVQTILNSLFHLIPACAIQDCQVLRVCGTWHFGFPDKFVFDLKLFVEPTDVHGVDPLFRELPVKELSSPCKCKACPLLQGLHASQVIYMCLV